VIPVPVQEIGVKAVAILCILALSAVNILGVRFGGWVQNVFTFLQVGALLGLVASVFLFGHRVALFVFPACHSEPKMNYSASSSGVSQRAETFGAASGGELD
jgi:amino acid transporter